MNQLVDYAFEDGVARITMDDGKLNVMSLAMLAALDGAFDRAARDEAVVLLSSGRERIFSAGFDLKVFAAGDDQAGQAMVKAGAELALKVLTHPGPVLSVCAGHAYPMGAFLILASDVRLGVDGPWRIGLNEVAIGIPVPSFALEIARQRLIPSYLNRTAVTGEMFAPAEAVTAGFLDCVVAPDEAEDVVAATLAALKAVHRPSHITTKRRLRETSAQAVRTAIDRELTREAYRQRPAANVRLPA